MSRRVSAATLTLLALLAGCGRSSGASDAGATTSAAGSSSATPALSGSAVASGSASSAPAAEQGAGWSGDYDAKKALFELPEKSKDMTWKKDPGDKNVGAGKLSISVVDGAVHGQASGALGDQTVEGTFDGKLLRVSLWPKNPQAADAMTGTAVGEQGQGSMTGMMRCTGPDAVMVREATFELKPVK